jgi:hypothetical protein
MEAVRRRSRDQMILTARAVWIATRATHDELTTWEDGVLGIDRALPPEALPAALQRASKGLNVITMAEYRKGKTGC